MRRPIVFVLLAGFAALVAALMVYSALKRREAEVRQAMVQSVDVVVAAHDLGIGTKLDPGALKTVRWAREAMPPGAFTTVAPLIGQFTKTSFVENEPIVASRLFSGAKNAGVLPLLIPMGMRAISVPVDEVSDIAGFVLPNTHVDVLVSIANGSEQLSKIVLQDVQVLAIAQEIENVNDKPKPVRVVTMLVSPDQAERLTLASHEGALRLAMRNYQDNKTVMTSGINTAQLLGAAPAASTVTPAQHIVLYRPRPKPKPVTVEVLRNGTSSESVSFIRTPGGSSGTTSAPAAPRGESSAIDAHDKAAFNETGDKFSGQSDDDRIAAAPAAPAMATASNRTTDLGMVGASEPVMIGAPGASGAAPGAPSSASAGYTGPHSKTIDVP
jgi:pilus assembly protein CpaB